MISDRLKFLFFVLCSLFLLLCGTSYILKIAAILKPSVKYNRRAAIIEGLHVGCSATEIIRFFGYPRLTIYDVIKYMALEQSNEGSNILARKSSLERSTAVVERPRALISDNPGQSLHILMGIVKP